MSTTVEKRMKGRLRMQITKAIAAGYALCLAECLPSPACIFCAGGCGGVPPCTPRDLPIHLSFIYFDCPNIIGGSLAPPIDHRYQLSETTDTSSPLASRITGVTTDQRDENDVEGGKYLYSVSH